MQPIYVDPPPGYYDPPPGYYDPPPAYYESDPPGGAPFIRSAGRVLRSAARLVRPSARLLFTARRPARAAADPERARRAGRRRLAKVGQAPRSAARAPDRLGRRARPQRPHPRHDRRIPPSDCRDCGIFGRPVLGLGALVLGKISLVSSIINGVALARHNRNRPSPNLSFGAGSVQINF
ncbi:hypothetical protein [Nannocystis pusilla]|uniref:hypothetical protein n=1 Tax=Nannocystis pusilla TaxID=889268 RepID=UPI003B7FFD2C